MALYAEVAELEKEGIAFASVVITGTAGIVPRKSGRMFVSEDGRIFGTIGGGEIEYKAKLLALEAIREGKGRNAVIPHNNDGSVSVFIDIPIPHKKAIIIGSGHVGTAVANLLRTTGWSVRLLGREAVVHFCVLCRDSRIAKPVAIPGFPALFSNWP